jgi:hypothetical protein
VLALIANTIIAKPEMPEPEQKSPKLGAQVSSSRVAAKQNAPP